MLLGECWLLDFVAILLILYCTRSCGRRRRSRRRNMGGRGAREGRSMGEGGGVWRERGPRDDVIGEVHNLISLVGPRVQVWVAV